MAKFELRAKESDKVVWTVYAVDSEDAAISAYAKYAGIPLGVANRYLYAREVA